MRRSASDGAALIITRRRSPPIPYTVRYAGTARANGERAIPITGNGIARSIPPLRNTTASDRRFGMGNGACAILPTTPQLWT